MHNTCVTSLRTRGGLLFSFNDYAHGSIDRGPCSYSSSAASCCCCCFANSVCNFPVGSGYCYNLYGLRQSSLIQWSPCRKLVYGGLDRFYSPRLPVCDVDVSFYCDEVLRPRQVRVGGRRKGGLRKCMVFEERSEAGDVDGAEILLSLLTEDVSEECLLSTKETRRILKKPVEKGKSGEVSKTCRSKKKRVDLGVLESEHSYGGGSVVSSGKKGNRRREEVVRREEEKEDLSRQENRKGRLKEECCAALVTTGTSRRKEESVGLLRKTGKKDDKEEEREADIREENLKVSSWREEGEDLVRREENRQKVRKEGSSCSSYYSFSSTGDYEIDDEEVEHSEGRYLEESASHKRDSNNNVLFNQEGRKHEGHRHDSYREDHGVNLVKKSTQSDCMVGSSVVESDFRKKSEKKLADVSVQELELREEASQQELILSKGHVSNYKKYSGYHANYDDRQEKSTARTNADEERKQQHWQTSSEVQKQKLELREEASRKDSRVSMERESNYKKSSDYHVDYDDRLEKSIVRTEFDEEREQQRSQTSNEVLRQTETRMKHKHFMEKHESHSDDIINFYGSQKIYSGKDEMSAKVVSSSQETVEERRRAAGVSTREDEYPKKSVQVAKASEVQDIDIRKTSASQQRVETSVREEDYSTNIYSLTNINVTQNQYDQASLPVDSSARTQKLAKKEGKSILKKVAEKHRKEEENVNVTHGSSLESKIIKRDDSKRRDDKLTKIALTHTGHSGKTDAEGRNETKSNMQVGIQTKLPKPGAAYQGSNFGIYHRGDSGKIDSAGINKTKSEIQAGIQTKLTEPSALSQKSNVGIATNEGNDGSLQVVSTSLHEHNQVISPELHLETHGEASGSSTQEQPSKIVPLEGTMESAAQLEQSSTQYVGEFINQVRDEILSSEMQEYERTKFVHEEQHHQEQETETDSQQSGTKGPSDEIWNVDEPSVQGSSITENLDDASKAGKDIDKRTGRSLWNVISDIALLRWSSHPESHSSGRKVGGKSSPTLSTSGETWFSGHEAAENEELMEEKEQQSVTLGLSGSNQGEKSHSHVEEGSSLAKFDGHLKHSGMSVPSSSAAPKLKPIHSLLHYGVLSEGMSTTTTAKPSIPLPSFRQPISPVVQGVSEAEEAKASGSGMTEKPNTESIVKTESSVDEGELRRKKFQRQDHVIRDRFDEWDEAYRIEAEQRKVDEMFMWEALSEAQNAADNWEVPVGAVLVHNGKIIARGFNRVEELRDSTAHAEMICIREASNMLKSWRLSETTLYVTLEPCPMCAGAILQARVDTVVWGAPNKLVGADGSWIRLFPDGYGGNGLELSDKPPAPVHPFHPKIVIRRGVLSSECADAMQQFFKLRRKKKDDKSDPSKTVPTSSHRPFKFFSKMHHAFNLMLC